MTEDARTKAVIALVVAAFVVAYGFPILWHFWWP